MFCAGMKAAYAVLAIVVMSAAVKGRHLMSEQPSSTLAKRLAALARDNTVVLTLASCGYLDFADNWIAHMEALGISNWLTVAQDAAALQYLSERQALSNSCVYLPRSRPHAMDTLIKEMLSARLPTMTS